jgi:hypothetical protein
MNKLVKQLHVLASGKNVLLLLGLYLPFPTFILPQLESRIAQQATQMPVVPLDLQFDYTAEIAYRTLNNMSEIGRKNYFWGEITIDILYPIIYGLLFSLLISWLFQKIGETAISWQRLTLVPLIAMCMDFLENISIINLIYIFPNRTPNFDRWAFWAACFGDIKWSSAGISGVAILFLFIIWGFKSLFSK